MRRDASVWGFVLCNADRPEVASIHAALMAELEDSTLRPVVWEEAPLKDAPQAHRAVMEPGAFGKIVLLP